MAAPRPGQKGTKDSAGRRGTKKVEVAEEELSAGFAEEPTEKEDI